MRVVDKDQYITIIKEATDSEDSFTDAFNTGIVTLMIDKKSKKVN